MFVLSISTGLYFSDYLNSKIPSILIIGGLKVQALLRGPYAVVVELVYTQDLGSCVERRKGSSPFYSTIWWIDGIGRHSGLVVIRTF